MLAHAPGAWDLFGSAHQWYGLVELAGTSDEVDDRLEAALQIALDEGLLVDAVVAGSPTQRAALWGTPGGCVGGPEGRGVLDRAQRTLPIASLPRFIAETDARLGGLLPGVRLVTYGHVGDGNLHYNLSAPVGDDAALLDAAPELTVSVYDAVSDLGGSISAEHGIGSLKRDAAASYKSDVEVDLMRAVKRAIDPQNLMNPGKVVV